MKAPPIWGDRDLVTNPFCIGLVTTEKMYESELKRLNVPVKDWPSYTKTSHAHACVHWLEQPDTGKEIVIVCVRVDPKRTGLEIAGLLVHEAVHIWQHVREYIGEDSPSSEFEAYSVQCIAQELMWLYREQVVKSRR